MNNKSRKKIEYKQGDMVNSATFIREIERALLHGAMRRRAIFICRCGKEFIQFINDVSKGTPDHCGCKIIKKKEFDKKNRTEYHIYNNMNQRCYNPKNKAYKSYGGRGISVCGRWRASFENFYEDMGERPGTEFTLERVNNDGIYEKSNCKWATKIEQARNKRTNRKITFNGRTMCMSEWCELYGMGRTAFAKRLDKGMSIPEAMCVSDKYKAKNKRREKTTLTIAWSSQKAV